MQLEIKRFFEETNRTRISSYHQFLQEKVLKETRRHGNTSEWNQVLESIKKTDSSPEDRNGKLSIGDGKTDYSLALKRLKPWRKGPILVGSTEIDSEWRSDWKWNRIERHVKRLEGKYVLDIGAGNGYYLFRMLEAGAELALGIDPTILFNYQFAALQRLSKNNNAFLLPLRSEQLPAFQCFDIVFCMGVLYHRRSPIEQLTELLSFLKPKGQLVLETLILPQQEKSSMLMPKGRYAKMANVWFIPSAEMLGVMLERSGYRDINIVDITATSVDEQRQTEWMDFQSLSDFLDPEDHSRTVEGYPAPTRAIVIARKP